MKQRGEWHEQAREMRAEGATYAQIGEAFGVTATAVYFVINPLKRAMYKKKKGAGTVAPAPLPEPA